MKKFIKENFVVILAFLIPILLIIGVALFTYLPSALVSSEYNFLYATCDDNDYDNRCEEYLEKRYSITDGKLIMNEVELKPRYEGDEDFERDYQAHIFLHDTEKNESREIVFDEARELDLSEMVTSPDGFSVSSDYNRGAEIFLLFDSGSSYDVYLTKGNSRKKLNIINNNDRYYYRYNFEFIGWILS